MKKLALPLIFALLVGCASGDKQETAETEESVFPAKITPSEQTEQAISEHNSEYLRLASEMFDRCYIYLRDAIEAIEAKDYEEAALNVEFVKLLLDDINPEEFQCDLLEKDENGLNYYEREFEIIFKYCFYLRTLVNSLRSEGE